MTKLQRRRQWALRRFDFDYSDTESSRLSKQIAKLIRDFRNKPSWAIDVKRYRLASGSTKTLYLHKSGSWLPAGPHVEQFYVPALDRGQWLSVDYTGVQTTFTCQHGNQWSLSDQSCRSTVNRLHSKQYVGPCRECINERVEHKGGFQTLTKRLNAYKNGALDPNHLSALYVVDVVDPADIEMTQPVVLYGIGLCAKSRIHQHRINCPSGLDELLVMQGRDEWVIHVEDYLKKRVTKQQCGNKPSYKNTEYLTGARRDAWREHLDAAMRHADTITSRYLPKAC